MSTDGVSVASLDIAEQNAASVSPQAITTTQPQWQLRTGDMFDRIDHPIEMAKLMGEAFAASKMFGCANTAQGFVLALACLTERKSPIDIMRKNHLIGGNLSMRSDAMLAEFRSIGGSHEIIERSADRAAIRLILGKRSNEFEFTWEEAKREDYVYTKDGKTLKDNWSTPRRRMQMLWARVVSDSIRAFCPEVCAGSYCPEELSADHFAEPGETISISAVPPKFQPAQATEGKNGCGSKTQPSNATTPSAIPDEKSRDQKLAEMRELKAKLDIHSDAWAKFLSRFGVKSALELDADQLDIALGQLQSDGWQKDSADELSRWAQEAVAGK